MHIRTGLLLIMSAVRFYVVMLLEYNYVHAPQQGCAHGRAPLAGGKLMAKSGAAACLMSGCYMGFLDHC